jgi:hypothetical protein
MRRKIVFAGSSKTPRLSDLHPRHRRARRDLEARRRARRDLEASLHGGAEMDVAGPGLRPAASFGVAQALSLGLRSGLPLGIPCAVSTDGDQIVGDRRPADRSVEAAS